MWIRQGSALDMLNTLSVCRLKCFAENFATHTHRDASEFWPVFDDDDDDDDDDWLMMGELKTSIFSINLHQGISHWVQCSRAGWGSQNQEWTWHPSKQIGRRWAQDHTGNIIGLCYLHWNLFWLNLSLHLVHLVLELSASVGQKQPGWQNFFALWIKMHTIIPRPNWHENEYCTRE